MLDLLIHGGQVYLPDSAGEFVDVGVKAGKIVAIFSNGTDVAAGVKLDASGLFVLPGIIDAHLHLGHGNDISRPRYLSDADQETAAAAAGGITTFIPYLLCTGPFENEFEEIVQITEAGARIDFGYHFIISTEAQLAGIGRYVDDFGVPSFKIFMNNRGGEGARLGLPDIDDGFLLRLCEAAADRNGLVCPHPENIEASWVLRDRLMQQDPAGNGGLVTWNGSRPPFVEADAVQRAGLFARQTGARLHIVHVSSQEALLAALGEREKGTSISIETCPQYLTHDVEWTGGSVAKVNPPLRTAADREALWAAIARNEIDLVATDHVHRGISAKAGGIWKASPGCPGLETMLPVLVSEGHHARGLTMGHVVTLLCEGPADVMGLSERKGRIRVGLDADFAIVDPTRISNLQKSDILSSAGYSIYEGWTFRGAVVHTIVRGQFALYHGKLADQAVGSGRYLKRRLTG